MQFLCFACCLALTHSQQIHTHTLAHTYTLSLSLWHFFACWRIKFIWELRTAARSTLPQSVWLAAKHKLCKTQQTRQARQAGNHCLVHRLLLVTVSLRFSAFLRPFCKFILWACSFQFGSKLTAEGIFPCMHVPVRSYMTKSIEMHLGPLYGIHSMLHMCV